VVDKRTSIPLRSSVLAAERRSTARVALKPESPDAIAVSGVYLESLGRVELADKKYTEAGPESTAKMERYFTP
jgi:hypothetical protein